MTRAAGCSRRARRASRRLSASAASVTVQELTTTTSAGAPAGTISQPAARRRVAIETRVIGRSLRDVPRDPAAAEDGVAAVEDGRLPGRDGRPVALEEHRR